MASHFRHGQQLANQLIILRRSSSQLNRFGSISGLTPFHTKNACETRRHFYNYQWDQRQQKNQKNIYGLNLYQFVSLGCVSVAIYNWKKYEFYFYNFS